jgi:hypothetical protein
MSSIVEIGPTLLEATTAVYESQLIDETAMTVPSAELGTLTLTLYDKLTKAIINGRSAQDIFNLNNGIISPSGMMTFTFQLGDTIFINPRFKYEHHIGLFLFTWFDGVQTQVGRHLVRFTMERATVR